MRRPWRRKSVTRVCRAPQRKVTGKRSLLCSRSASIPTKRKADGMTALHWAAYTNDVQMVEMLLKAGANINATTRLAALTPLFVAAREGHAAVIDLLLKAGADANSTNSTGATPLMLASGDLASAKLLLDHGA